MKLEISRFRSALTCLLSAEERERRDIYNVLCLCPMCVSNISDISRNLDRPFINLLFSM